MRTIAAGFAILLWMVTCALAVEQPGPSAALLANPIYSGGIGLVYTCVNNYYVATTGNDANPGTQAQPWATIQNADISSRSPGDCINVAPGSYSFPSGFQPTQGGNNASPTGYVVYRCEVLNECFTTYTGTCCFGIVWSFTVPYVVVDGFDIDGGDASTYGGNAIVCVSSTANIIKPGHHLWILNNNVHGCNQTGIQLNDSEYYFTLHNNVYDNSFTSPFEGSGVSYFHPLALGDPASAYPAYTPTAYDLAFAPLHQIISWNQLHDNGCTICGGTPLSSYQTTANSNATTTLSSIANVGTSASFTGSIDNGILTVTGITGTISVGDLLFFSGATMMGEPIANSPGTTIFLAAGDTGTGGNGTYSINVAYTTDSPVSMTSATLGLGTLVQAGPGVLPNTYILSIAGSTATLNREVTTTQSGGTFTLTNNCCIDHTDGNGVILDTWCGSVCGETGNGEYGTPTRQGLISFNDAQFNGGVGVHIFLASYVTSSNNSMYHNGMDLWANGFRADQDLNGSTNNSIINNNVVSVFNGAPLCSFTIFISTCNYTLITGDAGGISNANNVFEGLTLWPTGGALGPGLASGDMASFTAGTHQLKDPLFTNETSSIVGDLHLQAGSPAINYGVPQAYPFLPKGTTDGGAYQTGGLRTAFNVGGIPEFSGSLDLQSRPIVPAPLSCAEATAFLARISGYDRLTHDAYSNLICQMVNAGLYCGQVMDVVYIFATASTADANLNLCSATNYVPVIYGSPPFTAKKGYTGQDISEFPTNYIDTQFDPTTAVSPFYTQNFGHFSVWINNQVASVTANAGVALGEEFSTGAGTTISNIQPFLFIRAGLWNYLTNVNNDTFQCFSSPDQLIGSGHFLASRGSSASYTSYFDGTLQETCTIASGSFGTSFYVLASHFSGNLGGTPYDGPISGGPYQVGAVTIGAALTSTQQSTLCHLLSEYMTAIVQGSGTVC